MSLEVYFLIIFLVNFVVSQVIQWKNYDGRHLKANTKEFYKYAWDAYVPVPRNYSSPDDSSTFNIYIRKFSSTPESTSNHLWLISGGPGSSTSGIERALSVQLMDTTIYIMDNRGLGHSHMICHHSLSQICQANPKKCYESLDFSPKTISMHNTAQDYNHISRKILIESKEGSKIFMYGSSYGATLAYSCFKFDINLYSGLLLESFVPEFRLHGDADVHNHAIESCYRSETCRKTFDKLFLTESDAKNLMNTILKQENRNKCKIAIEFISGNNIVSLLNSYTRFSLYSKTKLRPALLPLLYGVAYCPDVKKFNLLLTEFHKAYQNHFIENSEKSSFLLAPSVSEMHCTAGSRTNNFFGNHIRFSEFIHQSEDKFNTCIKRGYLNSENWADVCGMVSEWKEDFRPFLYVPEVPKVSDSDLEKSQTRIVIAAGKLDTQTPYDLGLKEYHRLPLKNKFLFEADHAGHGIIDEWEVPGLNLNLILSFTMKGSYEDKFKIDKILQNHNNQPERIWKTWDKEILKRSGDIWDLSVVSRKYSWRILGWVLGGTLLVPLMTLILIVMETDNNLL